MPRHAVEPTQGVDVLEAIVDRRDLAQVDLSAVTRREQYDSLEILTVVSLAPGLNANIAILPLDRAGREIQRRRLNRPHDVIEREVVPAQIHFGHIDRDFIAARRYQVDNRNPRLSGQIVTQGLAQFLELPFIQIARQLNDTEQVPIDELRHHRPLGVSRESGDGIDPGFDFVG